MLENLSTNLIIGLVAAVAVVLLYLLALASRQPVLAKLGVRNIPRRPTQSALIMIGLTLSTVIIISALTIGDTLNYSVTRHAINAYGAIDQIIAPPLLSIFTQFTQNQNQPTAQEMTDVEESAETPLLNENLNILLTLLDQGLPGIELARYEQLRQQAEQEPLIDGVAPSIIFPTIIRNVSTGQGEPLGFVFAVDDQYTANFGLHTVEGEVVQMERLRPGVGNIFEVARNLFAMTTQSLGLGDLRVSDLARAVAGVGVVLSNPGSLGDVLQQTGVLSNTAILSTTTVLSQTGIISQTGLVERLNQVAQSGVLTETLQSMGVTTSTLNALGLNSPTGAGGDAAANLLSTLDPTVLLSTVNLNTLSEELDRTLGQLGLELRQGEVYLNRLGAQQLNARVGDRLDLFLGPLPLPYRVAGIVEESGPMGALTPVVMMRLDEAQRLLFMQNRINNVLISNLGDPVAGLEHTEAVGERLRILALNDARAAQIADKLRTPDYRAILEQAIAKEQEQSSIVEVDDAPAWVRNLVEEFSGANDFTALLATLPQELERPGVSEGLRALLANSMAREWLRNLPTPASDRTTWEQLLIDVNELDVFDALNKNAVVTAANIAGNVFSAIFTVFGAFSILAGILLIFLIFVMLAAERRSEMGMARALGVQRGHLVQMFVTEGMIYDLLAALLGLGLGLAVSFAMIGLISNLFNTVSGQLAGLGGFFTFYFNVTPFSLIVGYCLGVLLTFVVVTLSSWRVSRLNIVTAIRNLPDEAEAKPRSLVGKIWHWLVGLLWIVAGVAVIYYSANLQTILLIGITLIVIGVALLLGRLLERTTLRQEVIERIQYTLIGLSMLVLWGAPWNNLLGESRSGSALLAEGPTYLLTFVLAPVLLIFGAIMVVMYNAEVLTGLVSRLLGGIPALTPVLKTAIAYPLSTRFRTGMAMLMFAMIVCTVAVMAVVIEATQALIVLDEESSAGFEISTANTLLSFFDPIIDINDEIAQQQERYPLLKEIAATAGVSQLEGQAQQVGRAEGWRRLEVTGATTGYWQQAATIYRLQARAPGFVDDAAVWQALATRDDVALVTPEMLASNRPFANRQTVTETMPMDETGPERRFGRLWLQGVSADVTQLPELYVDVRVEQLATGQPGMPYRLRVIGLLAGDTTLADGAFQVNHRALERISGQRQTVSTYYLKVKPGADVKLVTQEVERAFLSNGINASVMAEGFAQGQAITRGVLSLLQGFMALGLLVGIAALGVITSRTVVERRQQVGVLRAVGYQAHMVGLSFLLEASFIAITGILIGAVVGILLGDNMVRAFFTELTPETQFNTPWLQISGILLLAYLFSLLTTLLPAWQSARIYPAEALRYE